MYVLCYLNPSLVLAGYSTCICVICCASKLSKTKICLMLCIQMCLVTDRMLSHSMKNNIICTSC